MKTQKVIIIGAGIGGLATANLLAKAGHEVHVYEKNSVAGGRAGLLRQDGFTFDTGPSWYLMADVFEHYYNLLGETTKSQLKLKRLQPAYKVFFEAGDPLTITSNLENDANTFESFEPGAGNQLKKYVASSSKIYKLALKHFLYSNFEKPSELLHPEIIKNSGALLKRTSRSIHSYVSGYVKDQRLQQILEYAMVFLGTSPFDAPSLYSLMSALDFEEGVFYPEGGLYTIITTLEDLGNKLGVQYHYNCETKHIRSTKDRATGIELKSGKFISADIVISNADLHHTETKLLSPSNRSYPETYWKKQEAGPSALLMYLGIKGKIPKFQHHNLLFVKQWKQNFEDIYQNKKPPKKASIYICKPSQTDASVAPKGDENIFVLVPLPSGVSLSEEQQKELTNHYLNQIKTMTGVNLKSRIITQSYYGPNDFADKLFSWQSSMLGPSHILKQSAFFRTPNLSKKLSNLYYVGAGTTPGIGLPMCLISAELVYKRIIGEKKGGRLESIIPIDSQEGEK